jgi:hypothetical protein
MAASQARHHVREHLRGQQVAVAPTRVVSSTHRAPFETRDERAHRRQTWKTRFEHNQRATEGGCRIQIYGVPAALNDLLGNPRDLPRAV